MKFTDTIYHFFAGKKIAKPKFDGEIIETRVSQMLFAGFSSSAAVFITHPLDVLKLNLLVKPMSFRELAYYHYMKDKSVTKIYKGVSASMARSMLYCNLRFELYELARRRNLLTTFYRKVIVASISGSIGGFVSTPLNKVHVRMQNDDLLPPNERRYYRGLWHGLYKIYHEEGPRQLFTGSLVSSLRAMMSTVGQIALYDEIKLGLLKYPQYLGEGFTMYLISSVAAGFVATLLQQPFEVISTQILNTSANRLKTTGIVVMETAQRNGIAGFYRGSVAGFVRIIPQTVVTYLILENLRLRFGLIMKSRKIGDVVEVITIGDELVCDESDKACSHEVLAEQEKHQRLEKERKQKQEEAQRIALEKQMKKKKKAMEQDKTKKT